MKASVYLQLLIRVSAAVFILNSFYSCNEPDFIGLDVQPENDKFSVCFEENLDINAYTVREDSVRADKTIQNLLGNYNDPVFGRTSAGFYTHLRLSSNNVDFGPNPVADSIVLSLVYKGHYGPLRKINVKVFEILDSFYKDSTYYSNLSLNIGQQWGSASVIPNSLDSLYIDGELKAPQLRIKMDDALAQHFFNESGTTNLSDNNAFLGFFKGIFVTTSFVNNEGAILYFDLVNTESQLTLYYKNDLNDSLKYNFVINEHCSRINIFEHYNYSNANPVLQQQLNGDSLPGDSILYVQAMAGTKIKLSFPNLNNFTENDKIVLNKAELIIPVEENDASQATYSIPEKLTLVRIKENGEIDFIIDQFEGESHFKGMYDPDKKQYSFVITRHLQNILSGNIEDYGLYILVSGSAINGSRIVLRGPAHSQNNMKLKITYLKL
ncbi:MAG: DUF4270 domain-containing protein [Bacteroidales bacterium]|nr:DUF4270 domain-containing protein [Bacteroidales bacterium]